MVGEYQRHKLLCVYIDTMMPQNRQTRRIMKNKLGGGVVPTHPRNKCYNAILEFVLHG